MTVYLHRDFLYMGLLPLHPLENGEHRGYFSPGAKLHFLFHLLQGTCTKPPSNMSTSSSWWGSALQPQPSLRVPGQGKVCAAGRECGKRRTTGRTGGGPWGGLLQLQPLGLENLPSPIGTVPSSQCSTAQALWKEGWISGAFKVFKIEEKKKKRKKSMPDSFE